MAFDSVSVLVLEPNPLIRRAIRDGLAALGAIDVATVGTAWELEDGLCAQAPDLVICDGTFADSAAVGMVRNLRHGLLGENPFTAALTTAETPTLTLVKRVMSSGTDALVSKPLSVQSVIDRVRAVTFHRRPFVVTDNYIGPVRGPRRRGAGISGVLQVPNTLRAKVEGTYDRGRVLEEIRETRSLVDEQKAAQGALLITGIVGEIARAVEQRAGGFPLAARLARLAGTVEGICRRLEAAGEHEVASLCRSLLKVIAKIRAEQDAPDVKDLELLQNLARAIHKAYEPDARIGRHAATISTAIQGSRRFQGV